MHCILPTLSFLALCLLGPTLHAERKDTVLEKRWLFFKGEALGAVQPKFDDSAWQKVSVPHTWNAVGEPKPSGSKSFYYRGPGWYRRTLEIPATKKGSRVFLRFEAASLVADIYLNGQKLGEHRGGFTAFCYEITDAVKAGPNLLAVRVANDNFPDIAPLSGDFTLFGGLYRPVNLLQTDALCISPLVDGAPGVLISTSEVSSASAKVKVTTHLSDQRVDKAQKAELRTRIQDGKGKTVAELRSPLSATAEPIAQEFQLAKPHLWDGIADPYLYTVRVELLSAGKTVDSVTQPLGLRTLTFDKEKGAVLNGHPYRLRGVCRHQEFGSKGWAISHADQEQDMALIREMGANAVRLAHYPHDSYFLSLCDRYGILAWVEVPNVNAVSNSPEFTANARQQLRECILQVGNHPSIFAWGLWNEIDGKVTDPLPLITQLKQDAHELDPTRPTTAAADIRAQKTCRPTISVTDIVALNTYPGWYHADPEGMSKLLDDFNQLAPSPIGVSEYGAGASTRQHEQGRTITPKTTGPWHPEEWQARVHEADWAAIAARPFVWGSFVWNMFDFASASRHEADLPGINDKGLVTRDRRTRKDAYFFYKASWSPTPTVYITSRRDAVRLQPETPVKVYSNAKGVTLKLNGVRVPGEAVEGVIHRWPSITLKQGENVLEASSQFGKKVVTDRVTWVLDPSAKVPLPPKEAGANSDGH